jgi:hypothetical protein
MTPQELWTFLPFGYLFSILIETPILLIGLSPRHSWKRRLFAGVWLTACTYPIVILVLPLCIDPVEHRLLYLAVAETFAPVAECALFWAAFGRPEDWGHWSMWRDFLVITLANLASFGVGELAYSQGWLDGEEPSSLLSPDHATGLDRRSPKTGDLRTTVCGTVGRETFPKRVNLSVPVESPSRQ